MKFILFVLVAVALFGTTSAFKKTELRQQVIDEFINSHDRVDKSCMAGKAAKCITKVSFWSLNYLRKQVSTVYDLKEDEKALKKKIKKLKKDEKTGEFWECVEDKMDPCFVEDDDTFLGLKKYQHQQIQVWSNLSSHRQEDEGEEEVEDSASCDETEQAKCEALVTDPSQWEKIDQQSQSFEDLDEEGASEEDYMAKIDELKADSETGEFWTCAFALEDKCAEEYEEEFDDEEGEEEEEE